MSSNSASLTKALQADTAETIASPKLVWLCRFFHCCSFFVAEPYAVPQIREEVVSALRWMGFDYGFWLISGLAALKAWSTSWFVSPAPGKKTTNSRQTSAKTIQNMATNMIPVW
jgi:hypothetical protein